MVQAWPGQQGVGAPGSMARGGGGEQLATGALAMPSWLPPISAALLVPPELNCEEVAGSRGKDGPWWFLFEGWSGLRYCKIS